MSPNIWKGVAFVACVAALYACQERQEAKAQAQAQPERPAVPHTYYGEVKVWTDPVTHCQYLVATPNGGTSGSVSITPRLWQNTNGMCYQGS